MQTNQTPNSRKNAEPLQYLTAALQTYRFLAIANHHRLRYTPQALGSDLVITYRLGEGLPSGITPRRVKSILAFVKSQEREFEDALNQTGGPVWKDIPHDKEFYERIQYLLISDAGRAAYIKAKNRFEQNKPKRKDRADFFHRLKQDCLKSLSPRDQTPSDGDTANNSNGEPVDSYSVFVRNKAWQLMAEYVWAQCVESGLGDDIANALKQHPQLSQFLSKVEINPEINPESSIKDSKETNDRPVGELLGEVERLVNNITKDARSLEPTRLDSELLARITRRISRLAEISEIRQAKMRNASVLKSRISKWQESLSEGISDAPELAERIAALTSAAEYSEISMEELESILTDLQQSIGMIQRKKELANELKTLENKASAHLELIDKELNQLDLIAPASPTSLQLSDAQLANTNPSVSAKHTKQRAKTEREEHSPAEFHSSSIGSHSEEDPNPCITPDENYTGDSLQQSTDPDVVAPNTVTTFNEINSDRKFNTQVRDTISSEISKGRYAFAYHLAQADPSLLPTPNVIKLIASNYVRRDFAALSAQFPTIANDITDDLNFARNVASGDSLQPAIVALIASAALTPARISTGGPVSQLLLGLEPLLKEQKSFWNIVRKVADVSLSGIQLNSLIFTDGNKEEHWKTHFQGLCKETSEWLDVERNSTIRYKPATDVWRRILDEWSRNDRVSLGLLFSQLQVEKSVDATNLPNTDIEWVKSCLNYWRQYIEREIDRIDRECRQITKFRPIDGPARLALRVKIHEALDLIDRWCTLFRSRPNLTSNYHLKQVEELRRVVHQHWEPAVGEICKLDSIYEPRIRDLFHRYVGFVGADENLPQIRDLGIVDLLHGELLVNEEFELDVNDNVPRHSISLAKILSLSLQDHLDFKASAVSRAKNHDFQGAELVVDFAVRRGLISEHEEDDVRRGIDEQRKRSDANLEQEIESINARLGAAYARGVIPTKEFEDLQRQVPSEEYSFGHDLRQMFGELNRVDIAIKSFEGERIEELKKRSESTNFRDSSDRKRINSAISEGRYLVAEDFLDRVAQDESLPDLSISQHLIFDRFFPKFVEEYTKFRDDYDGNLDQICKAIKHKKSCGPIDGGKLSTSEARDAISLITSWMRLFKGQPNKEHVMSLFSCLGFSVRDAKIEVSKSTKSYDDFVVQVKTDIVADRKISQLPEFGSHAAGNYRILFIRNRNTSQAIKQKTDALIRVGQPPLVVAFLNCLDTSDRRSLASQFAFGRQPSMLVLDDALVVFLALESANGRLNAFFDCTSAFSYASPYNPDASAVPSEMFFGRTDARRRIRSHEDASHLVFGGRRLGKTALLKSIESESDMRSKDQIVLYLDLNSTGIGQQRPVDDIWKALATHLSEKIAILREVPRTDTIRSRIKSWIARKPNRRILILLDEADNLLDSDRRHKHRYRVLSQIKDLMDQTNRQFKVVFSGLHNVQRSSRDPNTPLAHLGTPIQIGPMLPDRDGSEIENLIRRPLEALGYRFTSNDDVTHIAIQTNYYPALAQQFCKELLVHLREGEIASMDEGPPYIIPSATIRHVFDSKETRDRLRNIFSWTIQLDPRYEFLTFLIARQSLKDGDLRARGVSLSEIYEIALSEWPEGFETDSSFLTFEVLLEEMIGLGVLREIGWGNSASSLGAEVERARDRHFSIRTRSLRVLLGNDAEIERRYADSKTRAIPTHHPLRFRRTIDDVEIAPLTAGQEELLLFDQFYVGLVFGTELSGVDRVHRSLCQAAREMEGAPCPEVVDEDLIFSRLSEISRSKHQNSIALIVELRDFMDLTIVDRVRKTVEPLETRDKRVRVIFLCGPLAAWSWQIRSVSTDNSGLKMTWLSPCSIDFAHLWLKDKEIPAFVELENMNLVHMPWPVVMSVAAKSKHSSLKSAQEETLGDRPNLVSDVLEIPNAKIVLKALSDFDLNSPMTIDDIQYWLEESTSEQGSCMEDFYSVENLERVVEWAMRLSVVNKVRGGYVLDPTYAAGIRSITSK